MTSPSLIEPGVRYFIGGSLKECRKFKEKHYNMFFNLGMIVLFISVFGGILWYRHKGRLTSQEIDIKNRNSTLLNFPGILRCNFVTNKFSRRRRILNP